MTWFFIADKKEDIFRAIQEYTFLLIHLIILLFLGWGETESTWPLFTLLLKQFNLQGLISPVYT
jgi:hypothetical protein